MYSIRILLTALLLPMGFNVSAQDFEVADPIEDVSGGGDVIGGIPASALNWPATRIFRSDGGGCTSTIVGVNTILTAAHCVDDGSSGTVRVRSTNYRVNCTHHPVYSANYTLDFALCYSDSDFKNVTFENINTSIAYPRRDDAIILLGYGCLEDGGFDKSFGSLFIGPAIVASTPSGNNAYIVTNDVASVCYGDSGGAAYSVTPNTRFIVGVNSRGDIKTVSYLSSTSTVEFVDWALNWADANQTTICGVHPDATGCR